MHVLIAAEREGGLGVGRMGKDTLGSVSLHFFPWEETLEHRDGARFLSLGTTATGPEHCCYGGSLCQGGCLSACPNSPTPTEDVVPLMEETHQRYNMEKRTWLDHQHLGVRRLESEQQERLLGDLAGRDLTQFSS